MIAAARNPNWLAVGGGLILAAGLGFAVARLTAGGPAEPAAEAPAPGVAAELVVPAEGLAAMRIAVEPVRLESFGAGVRAPGLVRPAPGGEAIVTAQASGAVVRLAKRLGDPVRAGEALAEVASREAAAMAADRAVADAKAGLARRVLERERRLYEQKVTPRQDLEAAEAALAAAEAEARGARTAAATARVSAGGRTVTLVSPIDGRITAQSAALGAYVQPETELFHVADPRFVQVEASVPAADARRIQAGDPARVVTAGGERTATVRSTTPALDPETRAATVVLTLDGEGAVAPGEAVQVEIMPKTADPAGVVVPEEAVLTLDGRDTVFVRTAKGFRAQPVTVAARAGGRASIAAGLSAGQSIAVRNAFLLKAEATKGGGDEE